MTRFSLILATVLVLGLAAENNSNCLAQQASANSTRKLRVKPDRLAAKAGSAVNWLSDLDVALAKARSTGRPVFWYVPTIGGTFMDRKPVIDRYMMAGFFSYPEHIEVLNRNFVAVKAAPSLEHQKRFDLKVYEFIEPGFLVLDTEGKLLMKIDRITTQHPVWFACLLKQIVPELDIAPFQSRFGKQNFQPAEGIPDWPSTFAEAGITERAYQALFAGMTQFRAGKHAVAREIWQSMSRWAPDHPLTWKAAAEAQGIGPFVRGFEVFGELPAACLGAGRQSSGSAAPPGVYSPGELWERGTDFLLGMQNEQGGFVDSDYDFGGTDSLPNVHVAVTSLVGLALLEARQQRPDLHAVQIDRAIEGCFQYVRDEQNLNRVDRDEILWADAYRLRFMCRYARQRQRSIKPEIQAATTALERIQSNRGNWYHEYQNPFVTATALVALHNAQQAGANVEPRRIKLGLQALNNDRSQNGAFSYYSKQNHTRKTATSLPAAAGRMPICELALWRWGQSDQQRLTFAVSKSVEWHRHLQSALKYDNHTSNMGYGGFFFWYDMRSRTEAILAMENRGLRDSLLQQQKKIVMSLPEIDGCFVDSHELGRSYGTAMALICLAMCEGPHDEPPP